MRRQDELLALYPGSDPLTRKFILRQAEDLALAFDSDELLALLESERGSEDPRVANQAVHSHASFMPGWLRRRYALEGELRGAWSGYARRDAPAAAAQPEADPARCAARAARLRVALAPLTERLIATLAAEPGAPGIALALARVDPQAAEPALLAAVRDTGRFEPLIALAQLPAPGAAAREALEKRVAGGEGDSWLALSALPAERATALIRARARSAGLLGRIGMAAALARLDGADQRELAAHLMRSGEGWVAIWCLRALAARGDRSHVPHIAAVFDRATHEFVRAQAVAAAACIPGEPSLELCRRALADPSLSVQAQALEGLVRLGCPPEALRREAAPFLASRSVRSRVNALLACAEPGAGVPAVLVEMLMAPDELQRIEAVYALGFLHGPRALGCLALTARMDPSTVVRVQAIKSLSKYPAHDAIPVLVPLAASGERRVAPCAALALERYEAEDAAEVSSALRAMLSISGDQPGRSLLYGVLGAAAARAGGLDVSEPLARGLAEPDAACVRRSIRALCVMQRGASGVPSELRPVAASADAPTALRARLALLLAGELDALAAPGGPATGEEVAPLARLASEIALLAPDVAAGAFPLLARALDGPAPARSDPPPLVVRPVEPERAQPEAHEDAFAVQRVPRPRRSLRSGPAAVEPAPAAEAGPDPVSALEARLRQSAPLAASPADVARHLRSTSYLVAALPERLRGSWSAYAPLAAAAAALLLVGLLISRAAPAAQPPARPQLALKGFFEKVRVTPPGAPAVAGAAVAAGALVAVGEGSRATLETRAGGRVQLGPGIEARVRAIDEEGRELELDVTPGYCRVRFLTGAIRLGFGKSTLRARGAEFDVDRDDTAHHVIVKHGRVEAAGADGVATTVAAGQRHRVDP